MRCLAGRNLETQAILADVGEDEQHVICIDDVTGK